jgi:acetyl esterase/lipase
MFPCHILNAFPTLDTLLFRNEFAALLALAGNARASLSGHQRLKDLSYGDAPGQQLDLYIPHRLQRPAPLVVFIYGGNWTAGSKNIYPFLADSFTSKGYLVAIPDYRKYPQVRFPGFMHDIALALRWLNDEMPRYGANPLKVHLVGHSAGAQMALLLACDPVYLHKVKLSPQRLASVTGVAGPYAFVPGNDVYGEIFGHEPECWPMHPHRFIQGNEPPCLLLHGRRDHLVPVANARKLYCEMRRAGSPVSMKLYDNMGHLDILARMARMLGKTSDVRKSVLDFLVKH